MRWSAEGAGDGDGRGATVAAGVAAHRFGTTGRHTEPHGPAGRDHGRLVAFGLGAVVANGCSVSGRVPSGFVSVAGIWPGPGMPPS